MPNYPKAISTSCVGDGFGLGYTANGIDLLFMPHCRPCSILALCCLILATQLVFAQNATLLEPNTLYRLEGTVINDHTGGPVPHALVEVFGSSKIAMLTDAEGRFTIENLPQGSLTVSARKPGFYAPSGTETMQSFTSVTVGPNINKCELRLVPEAGFTGEITDSDGEPLEGASVQVLAAKVIEGRRQITPVGRNVTADEGGNFHLAGLPAGRYYLAVRPVAGRQRILGEQSKTATTALPMIIYFPASPDLSGATPIDLLPGQREHVTFTLKRAPAYKLAGVITGISAYQSVGPPIIVDDSGQALTNINRWDNQTGTFEFPPIPAGRYILQAYGVAADHHPSLHRETITLDHNVTDLNVVMQSGVSIAIVIRNELGPHSQPSHCVGAFGTAQGDSVDCSKIPAMVNLMPIESGPAQVSSQPTSATDPSLVLNGVMPGKYIVRVTLMMAGHVHSLRSAGVDLLRDPLIVPSGGQVPPIEVVLRDDGGQVKIRVRSDNIPKNGRVLLFPEFAPNLPPINLDIGLTGEREYGDLPPGDYKVFAFNSIDGLEYGNPEVMAKYGSKAATVTIVSNGSTTATVDLIHLGE
jgi:hypothetical protein